MARSKYFPYHIRRQCLRLFADGWSYRKIEAHTTIKVTTFRGWAKEACVEPNSKMTDEELDARIEGWREKFADSDEVKENRAGLTAQELALKMADDRRKFGMTKAERSESASRSWSELEKLGLNPDEWNEHMSAQLERTANELANATSPEQQVNALQARIGLGQMQLLASNPPPVTNWADALRVVSLVRQALGMDKDDGNKDTEAADIRVLTTKVDKGKVIEIGHGKRGRPKKNKRA